MLVLKLTPVLLLKPEADTSYTAFYVQEFSSMSFFLLKQVFLTFGRDTVVCSSVTCSILGLATGSPHSIVPQGVPSFSGNSSVDSRNLFLAYAINVLVSFGVSIEFLWKL